MQSEQSPKLHFLVYNAERELCRVTLPIAAVDNLANLFPDEDRGVVQRAGVDLPQIVVRARESGYAPQTLVDTHANARSYKIWIG